MKRLIPMVVLAVLILPRPVAGESSSLVERLMKDSTTTNLGKTSSRKKSSAISPALKDMENDINGHLEANRALREHLETRGSQGEDSRVKMKRQTKAKRQRWRDRQKEYEKTEPQR